MHPELLSSIELEPKIVPGSFAEVNKQVDAMVARSRRSFLGGGLAATAAGATLAAGATASAANSVTNRTIPSLYQGAASRYFSTIQSDEATHVNIIIAAIRSLGGTPRPFPTFKGITGLSPSSFLQTAIAFENTGVGAYFGASPYISNLSVLQVALSISTVEARHSGYLNSEGNTALVPNGLPYAQPLTISQVTAAATPYITSLNDNGAFPATFSTTEKSTANDIAILNFALLLEYLEAAFYFYNVPRLLG